MDAERMSHGMSEPKTVELCDKHSIWYGWCLRDAGHLGVHMSNPTGEKVELWLADSTDPSQVGKPDPFRLPLRPRVRRL